MRLLPDASRYLGAAALGSNVVAGVLILVTAGVTLVTVFLYLFRRAGAAVPSPLKVDWILVCGKALEEELPGYEYRCRLECAERIAQEHPASRLLLLGGSRGGTGTTEASAGAEYLVRRGMPRERIVLEQRSRNTLENVRQAIRYIGDGRGLELLLVTSRYHLGRSCAIAGNLGLRVTGCPAEPRRLVTVRFAGRLLWEAYLVHWYAAGIACARLTRREGLPDRLRAATDDEHSAGPP